MKIALLTMLTSIKRGRGLASPGPGYVPNVPTNPFRDQVVNLQVLPHIRADPCGSIWTKQRTLDAPSSSVSKKRIAHWIVEARYLAF